ncbi:MULTISPECIES: MerR family transcriptional regulator [unclassified Saccharothrix]|uniref:MerR family transcriptional regulator n=1 Tax=unclassified Saccharothrix TaxID=2593673 RepID=UPI00307F0F1B
MRIGELARRTGVSERLLRYYGEQGLLHPGRTPSGQRVYGPGTVEVVGRIRALLAAGISTAAIARVLPCLRDGEQRLIACAELPDRLRAEQADLAARIESLREAHAVLDVLIAGAERGAAAVSASGA